MQDEQKPAAEPTEETLSVEPEPEETEELEAVETAAESEVAEPVEEPEAEPEPPAEEVTDENEDEQEPEPLSRDEFIRITDEFGADIAAQTVKDGGNYSTALRAWADSLQAENDALKDRVSELEATGTGTPAKVVTAQPKKASLFHTKTKKS